MGPPLPTGHRSRCENECHEDAEAEDERVQPQFACSLGEGKEATIINRPACPRFPLLGYTRQTSAPPRRRCYAGSTTLLAPPGLCGGQTAPRNSGVSSRGVRPWSTRTATRAVSGLRCAQPPAQNSQRATPAPTHPCPPRTPRTASAAAHDPDTAPKAPRKRTAQAAPSPDALFISRLLSRRGMLGDARSRSRAGDPRVGCSVRV
jgi:hypothetical protein